DLSASVVKKRLRLEENLVDKPHLEEAIKVAGVHKVAMVAKLATPETEEMFAEKVKNMSKQAVQAYSKELRGVPSPETLRIDFDEDMTFLFLKLKKKLGKNLSNRGAMTVILKKMNEAEFPEARTRKPKMVSQKSVPGETFAPVKRYVSVVRRREELGKTNGRCAHVGCNRPPDVFHHVKRYGEWGDHELVEPLCKIHHEFAHNGITEKETRVDFLYQKYRVEALK
ncbi:MAG: hypothetical protein V1679_02025, partial [Candidatus Peregrinibacteria bacterium]